jgi:3-hydroxyacyl-CoA dehydrogenase/enoyl-CoA hydratase/3-hydroxybutyryl-CoA epimerase
MVESRYFAACVHEPGVRNMIGTLWYQLNAIKKGASRPAAVPAVEGEEARHPGRRHDGRRHRLRLGQGPASRWCCSTPRRRPPTGQGLFAGPARQGGEEGPQHAPSKRDALLARITPTTDYALLPAATW